jgi:DNA-binding response OmpR family regulator
MQAAYIVLLQSNPEVAQLLSASLSHSVHGVHGVRSVEELRHAVAKHHPQTIILDLESASFGEVEALKREFAGVRIVCTHRVADEEMWARTLSVGGDDCCPSSDTRAILAAALPEGADARSAAA